MKKKADIKLAYSVPALDKGLDILEALSHERRPLALGEIAKMLDRNSNEIFRMLDCLTRRGYLIRDSESGTYRLSLRLFELAHTNSPIEELIRSSHTPMRQLADSIGESCHLSTLNDLDLIVLTQIESHQQVRISIEPGARFPAADTASGKVLLAHLSDRETESLPRKLLNHELLNKIRTNGYCLDVDATRRGVMDLAVFVGKPSSGISCSLAISALRSESPKSFLKRTLTPLRTTAQKITAACGLDQ